MFWWEFLQGCIQSIQYEVFVICFFFLTLIISQKINETESGMDFVGVNIYQFNPSLLAYSY